MYRDDAPRFLYVFFSKQKPAYEMRISDWSSDVCSSDLIDPQHRSGVDQNIAICQCLIKQRPTITIRIGAQRVSKTICPQGQAGALPLNEAAFLRVLDKHVGQPGDRKSTRLNSSH